MSQYLLLDFIKLVFTFSNKEHAIESMVEALCHKSEGRGFESGCDNFFQSIKSFQPHHGLGVDSDQIVLGAKRG
jgi:hypothetical protein